MSGAVFFWSALLPRALVSVTTWKFAAAEYLSAIRPVASALAIIRPGISLEWETDN
jgi:hypothetical protein